MQSGATLTTGRLFCGLETRKTAGQGAKDPKFDGWAFGPVSPVLLFKEEYRRPHLLLAGHLQERMPLNAQQRRIEAHTALAFQQSRQPHSITHSSVNPGNQTLRQPSPLLTRNFNLFNQECSKDRARGYLWRGPLEARNTWFKGARREGAQERNKASFARSRSALLIHTHWALALKRNNA